MNRIILEVSDKRWGSVEKAVCAALRRALLLLKESGVALEVHLVTDAEMKKLSGAYHGRRAPVNVLSFPAHAFPHPTVGRRTRYLGEIYVAPQYARAHHFDPRFLVVHGLLHLLGYTHQGARDTIKMEQLEDRLLARSERKSGPSFA